MHDRYAALRAFWMGLEPPARGATLDEAQLLLPAVYLRDREHWARRLGPSSFAASRVLRHPHSADWIIWRTYPTDPGSADE